MEKTKIEYEQITVKIPKPVMAFLRKEAETDKHTLDEQITLDVVDMVRAQMEGMDNLTLIKMAGLDTLFYEILHDDRFKPQ